MCEKTCILGEKELECIRSGATLLQHLEPCSYNERQKEVMAIGKYIAATPSTSSSDPNSSTLHPLLKMLCDMAQCDDFSQRLLAVAGLRSYVLHTHRQAASSEAAASGVPPAVREFAELLIRDPHPLIFQRAVSLGAALFRSDDAVNLVTELPLPSLRSFCYALFKQKDFHVSATTNLPKDAAEESKKGGDALSSNQALLDLCFKHPAVKSFPQRRDIVARYGSQQLIRSMDEETLLSLSPQTHAFLTRRFPQLMVQHVHQIIGLSSASGEAGKGQTTTNLSHKPTESDEEIPVRAYAILSVVLRVLLKGTSQRHLGMLLLKQTLHRFPVDHGTLTSCFFAATAFSPEEMSVYLLQHPNLWSPITDGRCPARLRRRLYLLPLHLQLQLVSMRLLNLDHFTAFPASLRQYIYENAREKLMDSEGRWIQLDYLSSLPAEADRLREAKAVLAHPAATHIDRLSALRVFPLKTIRTDAKSLLSHSECELRQHAISAVIESTITRPEQLDEVLQMVLDRKNEQDPFRQTVWNCLSCLKVSIWEEGHLKPLELLIESMLRVKDLSASSTSWVTKVLFRVAWKYPEFAAQQLHLLHQNGHSLPWDMKLPISSAQVMWRYFEPLVLKSLERGEGGFPYSIRRLFPLQMMKRIDTEAVLEAYIKSEKREIFQAGIASYFNWMRAKASALVPQWLKQRPEFCLVKEVQMEVSMRYQGALLNSLLDPVPPVVRACFPGVHDNITFREHTKFYRWTAKQQKKYISTLIEKKLKSEKNKHYICQEVFRILPKIPCLSLSDGLEEFLDLHYEPSYLHGLMMGMLGELYDQRSLRELCNAALEEGEDGRAKEAIQPLATRLQRLSFRTAAPLLETLLKGKSIQMQKKAVVLLAGFGTDRAYDRLVAFEREKGTQIHKDVRLALLQAYWMFLWKPEVWAYYDTIARSSLVEEAAKNISKIPDALLTSAWQLEHFNELMLSFLSHENRSVRRQALSQLTSPRRLEDPRWIPFIYKEMEERESEGAPSTACEVLLQLRLVSVEEIAQTVSLFTRDRSIEVVVARLESSASYDLCEPASRECQLAAALARKLVEIRRQPVLAVRCAFLCGPGTILFTLDALVKAELLHTGVQQWVVKTLTNDVFDYSVAFIEAMNKAESEVLRHHSHPFYRRAGLAWLSNIMVSQGVPGWVAAIQTYAADEEMWTSDDAKLMLPN